MDVEDGSDLLIPLAEPGTSSLESVPPGESQVIAAVRHNIEQEVRTRATATGLARRDEHPKAHGCVKGVFEVLPDLPADHAVGLFAKPASYPVWVRFSNANGDPRPDRAADGRGVAIKLMEVEGSRSGTQDLIMMNAPRFFLRDAAQALAFNQAGARQIRFFFPGLNPFRWRLHELLAAMAITGAKMSNPLNVRYWSVAAYRFGDTAFKFSLRPAGPPFPFEDRSTPNFLHDNLVKSLASRDAVFDFLIQLRGPGMSIEDPTIEWRESAAPFTAVARLTVHSQDFDHPERLSLGENLSFTPWHGLDAHRPFGGINRVRRAVYEAISALRHELNGAERVEPTA